MSVKTRLFQIYYNSASRQRLLPQFEALDNTSGRADWHEYWPIRRFLTDNVLDEATYYGFFSPKFDIKVGLQPETVFGFIEQHAPAADVMIFCPSWDRMSLFWNVIEHGEVSHPGFAGMCEAFLSEIYPGKKVLETPNTSANGVFGNFFVARPAFWRRWLEVCERLFAIAEAGDTALGESLNRVAHYDRAVGFKVFLMERVASIILAQESRWRSVAYNPFVLTPSQFATSLFDTAAVISDALKTAYAKTGYEEHRNAFMKMRESLRATLARGQPVDFRQAYTFTRTPPNGARS